LSQSVIHRRPQPEVYFVENAARDPSILGNASDSCEAHVGGAAHDLKNRGDRGDAAHTLDIMLMVFHHLVTRMFGR